MNEFRIMKSQCNLRLKFKQNRSDSFAVCWYAMPTTSRLLSIDPHNLNFRLAAECKSTNHQTCSLNRQSEQCVCSDLDDDRIKAAPILFVNACAFAGVLV